MNTRIDRRRRLVVLALLVWAAAGSWSPRAWASTIKVNNAPQAAAGQFAQLQISPDSTRVVALIEHKGDGALYSAPIGGGAWVRLDAIGGVLDFTLSPDGSRVVYRQAPATDAAAALLYSVPVGGGAATLLSTDLPSAGAVGSGAQISADGRLVVYRVVRRGQEAATLSLVGVPLGGGAPVVLATSTASEPLDSFQISPDGANVLYLAGLRNPDARRLFRVPIGGGEPARLSQALSIIGPVVSFQISADSRTVVYQSQLQPTGGTARSLYAVPLAGGPPTRLSASFHPRGVSPADYQISPDNARLVYSLKPSVDLWGVGSDAPPATSLYSVALSGGAVVTLTTNTRIWDTFRITPDSGAVIYRGDGTGTGVTLYRAPLDGSARVVLNSPAADGSRVADFQISRDGARVVYRASLPGEATAGLYSVAAGGGEAVLLAGAARGAQQVQLSRDNTRVVYVALGPEARGLWSVPLVGGAGAALGAALPSGAAITQYALSPDGARALFGLRQAGALRAALGNSMFSAPLVGGAATSFTPPSLASGDVDGFVVSRDVRLAVYRVVDRAGASYYARPLIGGQPVLLNAKLPVGRSVRAFQPSPDGQRVLFTLAGAVGDELYGVAAASGEAVALGGLPAGSRVRSIQWTPDNARVVVVAARDGRANLYSLAATGGNARQLDGGQAFDGAFQLSADGTRVVFRAARGTGDGFDLYSVGLDAGEPSKLGGGEQACGPPLLGADGRFVLYAANADGRCALYRVPLTGGEATRLSAASSTVWYTQLSADGKTAVYLAQEQGAYGLYSIALDGGAPVKLSGALAIRDNGLYSSYALSPDGQVVFEGRATPEQGFGLYRVPFTGGEPVAIAGVPPGGVARFQVTRDGARLVYQAQSATGSAELYGLPLAGGTPTRLNDALATSLSAFALSFDSFALYLADQEGDGQRDLVVADFGPPAVDGAEYGLSGNTLALTARLATPSVLTSTVSYTILRAAAGTTTRQAVASGQLTFAPGETRTTAQLRPTASWIPGRNEQIVAVFGAPTNATLPAPLQLALPFKDRGLVLPLIMRR
jgi:Tol biopolymer transport system component